MSEIGSEKREDLAEAWDKGALWAAVECGAIRDEAEPWLAPGDNPYRRHAEEPADVLSGTGVTANTWQSAARRLVDENRRLSEAVRAVAVMFWQTLAEQRCAHQHPNDGGACYRCRAWADDEVSAMVRRATKEGER